MVEPRVKSTHIIAWAVQSAGASVRVNTLQTTAKEFTVSVNDTESRQTVSPPQGRSGNVSVWPQGICGPKSSDYILEMKAWFAYVYVMICFPRNKYF